ncbi:hypothetical protein MRX96_023589 [Rhipicephalus microplus]
MFGRGRRRGRPSRSRFGRLFVRRGSSGALLFFPCVTGRFPVTVPLSLFNPNHRFGLGGVSSAKPGNVSPGLLASTFSWLSPTPSYGSPGSGLLGASHTPSS